jgi:hypothetical protein
MPILFPYVESDALGTSPKRTVRMVTLLWAMQPTTDVEDRVVIANLEVESLSK